MAFKRVLRYLQGAIVGRVIGRHGSGRKTALRGCNRFCPKVVQNPTVRLRVGRVRQAGGVDDVSACKRLAARPLAQTVLVASLACSLSERHPLPPPPHVSDAGT